MDDTDQMGSQTEPLLVANGVLSHDNKPLKANHIQGD
jgi:hypothetical protein